MSDEQKKNNGDVVKPTNMSANNICAVCKKNRCVCTKKVKTKPSKLTWI